MAKVAYTGSVTGFRGRIGNMIFRQMPSGSIVVSEAPPKLTGRQKKRAKLKRSDRQKAHNSSFREAAIYARQAAKTQPVYAELAAAEPMKTAYNFALSDWFHAPVVHCVEHRDGHILVQANDNVRVARVRVTILSGEGIVLEKGEAVRGEGDWWAFTPQTHGAAVLAEAWDLAGNLAQLTVR